MPTTLLQAADTFIDSWKASAQAKAVANNGFSKPVQPANALVLAVNLSPMGVKSAYAAIKDLSADDLKASTSALRTNFAILKVLWGGWSSVEQQKGGGKKGDSKKAPRDLMGEMEGDSVKLYTYELECKKGVYTRGGRLDDYVIVSPGMVCGMAVFPSRLDATFKGSKEDIPPFTMMLVQLGVRSVKSDKMMTNGQMLEIKAIEPLFASSLRIPNSTLFGRSLEECELFRERFLTTEKENCNPKWIENNLSSTMRLMCVTPRGSDGVFKVGADGRMHYHVAEGQHVAGLNATAFNLHYDLQGFGLTKDNVEWLEKLLNLCCMIPDAVEMFVAYDSFSHKEGTTETALEAYVRLNVLAVVRSLESIKASPASEFDYIVEKFPASSLNHLVIYQATNLDIVVDTRAMTRKVFHPNALEASESLICPTTASWTRATPVYFFYEKQAMMTALVPAGNSFGSVAELVKDALKPSVLMTSFEDAEFETPAEVQPAAVEMPPPPAKKAKKASA